MKLLALCLMACMLMGCAQRYVGVQITSTAPMSFTRVLVNGDVVVIGSLDE